MNIEALKLDLIQWILLLKNTETLSKINKIKENCSEAKNLPTPRQFGCGKGIFTHIAEDFDTTPPGFEEYMLP